VTEYRTILTELMGDGVAVVRLDRPERRNALNQQLMEELVAVLGAYDDDDAVGAVRLAKQAILRAEETSLEQGLAAERQGFYLLFGTEDAREGIRAFLEKRRPSWKGK